MNQHPVIFSILRPVNKPYPQLDKRYEKIVFVDPDTLDGFQQIPFYRFWKKHRSFWVSGQTFAVYKDIRCNVDDFDSKQSIALEISCRVRLINGKEHLAALLFHKENDPDTFFVNKLTTWLLHFTNNQKNFSNTYFQVENELINSINNEAAVHGLELQLSITPHTTTPPPTEYALIKQNITCQIRDREVDLICTMVMNLTDQRRFRMAQITDIDQWLKSKLERIAQNILIEKTFVQFLQKFDDSEIQKKLSEEVLQIGYTMKQLISVPNLEVLDLLNGFTFNTENGNTAGSPILYNTRDRRLPVSLDVIVKGKVSSFEGMIAEHLKPQTDLLDVMRKQVIETIRHFIQGITPERFYLHFSSKFKGEIAFEVELEQMIRNLLETQFNAKDLSIIITPLDTQLTNRFHELESQFWSFDCQSMSERIKYTVQFSVTNVHPEGWYTFKSKRYNKNNETGPEEELRVIGETLRSYMEATLNSITNIDIMVRRDNRFDLLMEEIFRRAAEKVTTTLGLVVECISLDRHKVEEDEHYNRMLEEKGREIMEKEYELMLSQAKELLQTRSGDALSMLKKHEEKNVLGSSNNMLDAHSPETGNQPD